MFERHLVAVVFALVAFVHASANVGIVIPVDLARLNRVAAKFVRRQVFGESLFVGAVQFDRCEAGVGEHRFGLSNILRLRGFVALIHGASRRNKR